MAEAQKRDEVDVLRRLMEITASLNSTLDLDELLQQIMTSASDLLGAETSSLLLVDEETSELVIQVATGEPAPEAVEQRIPAGQGIAGWVAERGEPAVVDDPAGDERFYTGVDRAIGFETRNLVAVPLSVRGRVIGVVEVINKGADGGFTPEDVEIATALSNQAAIAIDNARLYAKLADAVVTSRMSYRL